MSTRFSTPKMTLSRHISPRTMTGQTSTWIFLGSTSPHRGTYRSRRQSICVTAPLFCHRFKVNSGRNATTLLPLLKKVWIQLDLAPWLPVPSTPLCTVETFFWSFTSREHLKRNSQLMLRCPLKVSYISFFELPDTSAHFYTF